MKHKSANDGELFESTAKWLFFNNVLMVGNKICKIVEVEFYKSPDPFIQCNPEQLEMGRFYFHRTPTNDGSISNYDEDVYKGLDITIGNKNKQIYSSILIRSITLNDKIIEGPSNVIDFILKETGHKDVKSLVDSILKLNNTFPININTEGACLRILPFNTEHFTIYKAPRVGLTLKRERYINGPFCQYIMEENRFTCSPKLIKKCKYMFVVCARKNDIPDNVIIEDFNISISSGLMSKWISFFIKGKTMNVEYFFQHDIRNLSKVSEQLNAYGYFSSLTM